MNLTPDRRYLDTAHFAVRMVLSPEYEALLSVVLAEYEKRWPRRPIDLLGAEAVESGVHLYHLMMEVEEVDDEKAVNVDVDYFQQPGRIRPRGRVQRERDLKGVQRIFQVLESGNIECHFHCHVSWEFPRERYSTMINLPLMNLNLPGVSFNKVSGVRLSAAPGQNVVLDQTLDASATSVAASFTFYGVWSQHILQKVVQEGETLIEYLVIENPQETVNNDDQP